MRELHMPLALIAKLYIMRWSLSIMAKGRVRQPIITPMHRSTSTGRLVSPPPTASSAADIVRWVNSVQAAAMHTWSLRVEVDLTRR